MSISAKDSPKNNSPKNNRSIAAKWSDVVLVCKKCSKKLDGGFGKKHAFTLDKALKADLTDKRGPKVLAVPCIDICPKQAVCVMLGSDPGRVHLIAAGTPVDSVIAMLRET